MMQQGGGGFPGSHPPIGGTTKVGNLQYNQAALLCYVPVMGINVIASLIFIVTEPAESKLVRFHALQSLLLICTTFVGVFGFICAGIAMGVLGGLAGGHEGGMFVSILGLLLGLGQVALVLGILVLAIVAMIKAYQNEMWQIPLIGRIAAARA